MKFLNVILAFMLCVVSFPIIAIDKITTGKVKYSDAVSGPGKRVIQYKDGTAEYYDGNKLIKVKRPSVKKTIPARTISYSGFTCISWNRHLLDRNLNFEKGAVTAKTYESKLIKAYIQGVLDAQGMSFSKSIWTLINAKCKIAPQTKKISVILKLSR